MIKSSNFFTIGKILQWLLWLKVVTPLWLSWLRCLFQSTIVSWNWPFPSTPTTFSHAHTFVNVQNARWDLGLMIRKLRFYRTFKLEVVCVNRCGYVISALQLGRLHTYIISSRYQRFITNRSTSHLHNAEKNIVSNLKIANRVLKWLNTLIPHT